MTDQTKELQLKPCPFCGEQPQTKEWDERGKEAMRIWCDECSVQSLVQTTKTGAIAAWNTRAESALNPEKMGVKKALVALLRDTRSSGHSEFDSVELEDNALTALEGDVSVAAGAIPAPEDNNIFPIVGTAISQQPPENLTRSEDVLEKDGNVNMRPAIEYSKKLAAMMALSSIYEYYFVELFEDCQHDALSTIVPQGEEGMPTYADLMKAVLIYQRHTGQTLEDTLAARWTISPQTEALRLAEEALEMVRGDTDYVNDSRIIKTLTAIRKARENEPVSNPYKLPESAKAVASKGIVIGYAFCANAPKIRSEPESGYAEIREKAVAELAALIEAYAKQEAAKARDAALEEAALAEEDFSEKCIGYRSKDVASADRIRGLKSNPEKGE